MRALLLLAWFAAGCVRAAGFACETDAECTRGGNLGTCEAIGRCSFPDPSCPTGRRFAEHAGDVSEQCVGTSSVPDAGTDAALVDAAAPIDASLVDAAPDAPPDAATGCPAGYQPLPGIATHYYKRVAIAAGWTNQRAICGNEPANVYLAIPNDDAELLALVALAGEPFWIGISDAAEEGDYMTVLGAPATFVPWAQSEPDNNGNQDCVRARDQTGRFETELCGVPSIAICECQP